MRQRTCENVNIGRGCLAWWGREGGALARLPGPQTDKVPLLSLQRWPQASTCRQGHSCSHLIFSPTYHSPPFFFPETDFILKIFRGEFSFLECSSYSWWGRFFFFFCNYRLWILIETTRNCFTYSFQPIYFFVQTGLLLKLYERSNWLCKYCLRW